MARKNEGNQKAALRSAFSQFLRENDISIEDSNDVNSIMKDMISLVLEGALDGEMDEHLGYSKYDYEGKNTGNSRNGYSKKTVHTSYGNTEIDVPRDRQGEFEPQILPEYSTVLSNDLEAKILSMYGKGMTTSDIEAHMKDTYGVEISDSSISRLTDKIMPIIKEWQERPLEEVYAVVYMDAIHFHVRTESERWTTLATYFKYPEEVRRLIYTTNTVEGFNRQLRKLTKSRTVFPTDDSLLKLLYLATEDITKKWTGRRQDWSRIRAQLDIYFEERMA